MVEFLKGGPGKLCKLMGDVVPVEEEREEIASCEKGLAIDEDVVDSRVGDKVGGIKYEESDIGEIKLVRILVLTGASSDALEELAK